MWFTYVVFGRVRIDPVADKTVNFTERDVTLLYKIMSYIG